MKGHLSIKNEPIGEVNFSLIDESMGAIGGNLIPNKNYNKYQVAIRQHFEKKGVSNIHDFDYKILFDDGSELELQGGISVTDSADFDEIYVEAAGLDLSKLENNTL